MICISNNPTAVYNKKINFFPYPAENGYGIYKIALNKKMHILELYIPLKCYDKRISITRVIGKNYF